MNVKYIGNYRGQPAVNYRGVSFEPDKASEVSEEWFELNGGGNVVDDSKTKPKAKPKPKAKVEPNANND